MPPFAVCTHYYLYLCVFEGFVDSLQVVVYHTGVEHGLVDSEYNQRRETVKAALDTGVDSSTDVSEGELDELPAQKRQRLGDIVRENERVQRATEALASGDAETFGDLLVRAHRDIAGNYDASCEELVDADEAGPFARALDEDYRERFPEHESHFDLMAPSDGVGIESP